MPYTSNPYQRRQIETNWMNATEAAEYIRVSEISLRRYRQEGLLPFYRPKPRSTIILYNKKDLDAFLQGNLKWYLAC